MAVNFKHIQATYADALRLQNLLTRPNEPIGQETMTRFLGGGKVLHYEHKGRRETIIVSRIAATEITIICGPAGSGKTNQANEIAGQYDQVLFTEYAFLLAGRPLVPHDTQAIVIDNFPSCGKFNLLLSGFVSSRTNQVLPVHVIACVQMNLDGWEPAFLFAPQLKDHPVTYIKTTHK